MWAPSGEVFERASLGGTTFHDPFRSWICCSKLLKVCKYPQNLPPHTHTHFPPRIRSYKKAQTVILTIKLKKGYKTKQNNLTHYIHNWAQCIPSAVKFPEQKERKKILWSDKNLSEDVIICLKSRTSGGNQVSLINWLLPLHEAQWWQHNACGIFSSGD